MRCGGSAALAQLVDHNLLKFTTRDYGFWCKAIKSGANQAFALQTNDQLLTAAGFNDYILANRSGTFGASGPVRVRDVGRAIVAPQDVNLAGWMNTAPAIIIAVQRQSGANVIATVDAIKKALPQLEASLPPSIKIHIVSDRTQTIRASVADVQHTLLLTVALVVGVIFLFLRKLWATVIPAISVPMSLIGTFAVMYVLGYSLDNLSLMALTIAVGFVVDDAIVMIENIVRHIEDGKTPMQAALQRAGEIGFTILSISISLMAVFIPLFLMSGIVGLLFREFAVTVAVAIVVSVIVSLTLTPMMCARVLTAEGETRPGLLSRGLESFFDRLAAVYDRGLVVALHLPPSIATTFQGSAHAFQNSLSSTPILILAALIAVYIILGMLYESTIHPITIISTLPSAGLGALLTLILFGMPLDVIGIIGIILLIGIVKKNGIMLVGFTLAGQRERGLSTEEAIHEACRLRFRPIIMTTMCALLADIPLMLGTGIGSEIRQPLGYAIVGGLLVSQLLTLFTTPVVYIYMDRLGDWLGRGRAIGAQELTVAREADAS